MADPQIPSAGPSVGGFFRAISLDWRLQAVGRGLTWNRKPLGEETFLTMVVDKKGSQIFVFWMNCGLVYQVWARLNIWRIQSCNHRQKAIEPRSTKTPWISRCCQSILFRGQNKKAFLTEVGQKKRTFPTEVEVSFEMPKDTFSFFEIDHGPMSFVFSTFYTPF